MNCALYRRDHWHFDKIGSLKKGNCKKRNLPNRDMGKHTLNLAVRLVLDDVWDPNEYKTIIPTSCSSGTEGTKIALGEIGVSVCFALIGMSFALPFFFCSCESAVVCIALKPGCVWITPWVDGSDENKYWADGSEGEARTSWEHIDNNEPGQHHLLIQAFSILQSTLSMRPSDMECNMEEGAIQGGGGNIFLWNWTSIN